MTAVLVELKPECPPVGVPTAIAPSPEFLGAISHEFARRHLIVSEGCVNGTERLIVAPQTRPAPVFNVGVRLGRPVETRAAPAEDIAAAIDKIYAGQGVGSGPADGPPVPEGAPRIVVEGSLDVRADLDAAVKEAERDLLNTQGKAPAVRLVDLVLFEALLREASDVHIQPVRGRTLVRYRLDGVLHTVRELPLSLAAAVVSRVKIMARLDVAETRAPQDGRATVSIGGSNGPSNGALNSAPAAAQGNAQGRRVDLRVSTLPSTY